MISTRMKRTLGAIVAAGALTALAAVPAFAATPPPTPTPGPNGVWTGLPDPGAKANAPQTDLVNHPKGSLQSKPQPAAVAGPASDAGEVVSTSLSADGKLTNVSIYEPAQGVTPAQLVTMLKAKGINASVQSAPQPAAKSSTVSPLVVDPNECAYGVARAASNVPCPVPAHWANEGFANPHVRFNDHTGSAFPVDTAVYDWNTANGINSYYLYNSCPFQAGARCVDVSEVNNGADGYDGLTNLSYNADLSFADGTLNVTFNDYYMNNYNATVHKQVTEHELGHAVGLGHSPSIADIMYTVPRMSTATVGSPDDFTFLANLYSIDR